MTTVLFVIHIGSLCVSGLGILWADSSAFGWLRGRREVIDRKTLFVSHLVVTAGLAGLVLSGLALFWPMRDYLLQQPLFLAKMGFVTALLINSFCIEYLMHTASHRSFGSLSRVQKIPFLFSGAVSTISWAGAVSAALLLFR